MDIFSINIRKEECDAVLVMPGVLLNNDLWKQCAYFLNVNIEAFDKTFYEAKGYSKVCFIVYRTYNENGKMRITHQNDWTDGRLDKMSSAEILVEFKELLKIQLNTCQVIKGYI